jgi:hypothetical protein
MTNVIEREVGQGGKLLRRRAQDDGCSLLLPRGEEIVNNCSPLGRVLWMAGLELLDAFVCLGLFFGRWGCGGGEEEKDMEEKALHVIVL